MLVSTFLAAWLIIGFAPQTPIGRALIRMMVETPAIWLCRIKRGHVLLTGGLLSIGAIAIHFGGADAVVVMRLMSPDVAGFLITVDVATYVDVLFTLAVAASSGHVGRAVSAFGTSLPQRRAKARSRRSRPAKSPDNDNEEDRTRIAA